MNKQGLFYMEDVSGDDEDNTPLFAFIINFKSEQNQKTLEDFLDEYNYPASELEEEYGVHDWITFPVDDLFSIGYCSYEIEGQKNWDDLMMKWRQYFVEHADVESVSKVVVLNGGMQNFNSDMDLFMKVKEIINE